MTHWNLIVCEELCILRAELWCQLLQLRAQEVFNLGEYTKVLTQYKQVDKALENFPRGMVEYCTY